MIQPKKSVQKMQPYIPPLENRRGKLRLDFNENTIGCSPKVVEAFKKIKPEDIASYPEYSPFIKKLASSFGVNEENLLIANAGDEAIMVLMQTFVEKGDSIIIPAPTFAMFKFYAQIAGANIIEALYNNDLSFPADRALKKISKKTKLVVLVSPNNPTGTSIKTGDIIKIIEAAKDSIVLLDEAYYQFSKISYLKLIKRYNNLVILRTFSKAFGLAGLRLGCLFSNKEIIKTLRKVRSPYSINTTAVIAANAALDDKKFVENYVEEILKAKEFLCRELSKLKIRYVKGDANFILAYFGSNCKKIVEKLRDKNILVRDRSADPLLNGFVRITIGTKEQMQQLVNALERII